MSKQITAPELAEIVSKLLTDPNGAGELSGYESYQAFMTDIAQVVCNHCGGEIHHPASDLDDIWYVGIHGNASLPSAFGGIWREYDKDGELFSKENLSLEDFQIADALLLKALVELPERIRDDLVAEVIQRGYDGTNLGVIADVLSEDYGREFNSIYHEDDNSTATAVLFIEELADRQLEMAKASR